MQVWLNLVLDLMVAGLALTITSIAVSGRTPLSTSAVGLALVNITTLGETLKNLVVSYTALETSLGAIARLESFSRTTPRETTPPPPPPHRQQAGPAPALRQESSSTPSRRHTQRPAHRCCTK